LTGIRRRLTQIVGFLTVIILLFAVFFVSVDILLFPPSFSIQVAPGQVAVTPVFPRVTITPPPFPISSQPGKPVLGSFLGTFVAVYGQPTRDLVFFPPEKTSISALEVETSSKAENAISRSIVTAIFVEAFPSSSWNIVQAGSICNAFVPLDAQYMRQMQVINKKMGDLSGIVMVYSSASLARQLAVLGFAVTRGKQDTISTFTINYTYRRDTAHIGSCQLQTGLRL
jgi:hypothetical protein